jgi:hypothetical protein
MKTPVSKAPLAYSLTEAAQAVGISVELLKTKIRAGDINPRYVNSKPVIPVTELQAWVDSLPLESRTERGRI